YAIEDKLGNFYAGRNNVYQRAFTNGNFEPTYKPADFMYDGKKGTWKNIHYGKRPNQQVTPSKVRKYFN
ncbi:MAG: hypothetical protein AAF570_28380, partial [Bacteroidota bacterium]